MKLTNKQLKEFKLVNNLRKQMLRKKGKFIRPEVWEYGFVTDLEDNGNHSNGALIFIEHMNLDDLEIKVENARN